MTTNTSLSPWARFRALAYLHVATSVAKGTGRRELLPRTLTEV